MRKTRDLIVMAAADLLELQGYQATSLSQVLERSAAPKGSLYHYFPGGKDELVAAAVERSAQVMTELIQGCMTVGSHPVSSVSNLILSVAERVRASNYRRGSLIATVALEAAGTGGVVDRACRKAYSDWWEAFRVGLLDAGYTAKNADGIATLVVGLLEGAVLLSRVQRSTEPLLLLSDQLFVVLMNNLDTSVALHPEPSPTEAISDPLPVTRDRQPVTTGWRNW
jgi:TetR/AcrR family transcriptional repressor of lmrAB and yxaGH operons